jgi:hypothetical protein
MMSHGKPVLVTPNEENSALPADAVIRVDPGESETEMLACYLQWLAEDTNARSYFGRNAADYVSQRHELKEVAEHYRGILESHRTSESQKTPFTTRDSSVVESNRD